MHVRPIILVALFVMAPVASSEFGEEDAMGWPVGEDGFSHDPAQTIRPDALAAVQQRAMAGLVDEAGEPLNQVAGATIYPYYPIVVAEVQRLAADHPDRVKLHVAGQSELGLDLYFLEIADFGRLAGAGAADAVPLEDREVVWIDGGTHSNEYSGVYFVLAVAQYLIESYGEDEWATWAVDNRHTWIMPMVNVDGSHVMGRLNANLVNINRNYPVVWDGEGNDALMNNRGPTPASEVETQVNIDWFERLMPDYYASVHCCGNLWLFPYGEEGVDPPADDFAMLEAICDEAFPDVRDDCGPIWSTIYPASGSSVDTAYEVTGAAAWGFEMSGRSNLIGPWGEPVTFEEVFDQERESWAGIQHAFENVHRYGAFLEVKDARLDDAGLHLTVLNSGMGNLTASNVTVQAAAGEATTWTDGILAGETRTLHLPWPGGDAGDATLVYQERVMAAPLASARFIVSDVSGGEVDTPAPGAVLALLVAGLAAAAWRRRP